MAKFIFKNRYYESLYGGKGTTVSSEYHATNTRISISTGKGRMRRRPRGCPYGSRTSTKKFSKLIAVDELDILKSKIISNHNTKDNMIMNLTSGGSGWSSCSGGSSSPIDSPRRSVRSSIGSGGSRKSIGSSRGSVVFVDSGSSSGGSGRGSRGFSGGRYSDDVIYIGNDDSGGNRPISSWSCGGRKSDDIIYISSDDSGSRNGRSYSVGRSTSDVSSDDCDRWSCNGGRKSDDVIYISSGDSGNRNGRWIRGGQRNSGDVTYQSNGGGSRSYSDNRNSGDVIHISSDGSSNRPSRNCSDSRNGDDVVYVSDCGGSSGNRSCNSGRNCGDVIYINSSTGSSMSNTPTPSFGSTTDDDDDYFPTRQTHSTKDLPNENTEYEANIEFFKVLIDRERITKNPWAHFDSPTVRNQMVEFLCTIRSALMQYGYIIDYDVVHRSITIIENVMVCDKTAFKLEDLEELAIASMCLALKSAERYQSKHIIPYACECLQDLGYFDPKRIAKVEFKMLQILNFNINSVSCLDFIHAYCDIANSKASTETDKERIEQIRSQSVESLVTSNRPYIGLKRSALAYLLLLSTCEKLGLQWESLFGEF